MDNILKIINYLGKNMGKSFTMHELSKAVKVPYATFHREIKKMSSLVTSETVGKAKTIEINLKNPVIKSYLAISSEEEKKGYLKGQPIIRKIASELSNETVVLFGSYAKHTHNEKSDIDLMVIGSGKRTIYFSEYELLFKKRINPIFITKKEFQLMLKEKEENVGKQALKNHIILSNPENFWECVLNA